MKFLVLGVLALLGWWIWRRFLGGAADKVDEGSNAPLPARAEEAMAACAHCGTYAPVSDMCVAGDGRRFCSPAHLAAACDHAPAAGPEAGKGDRRDD